MALTKAEQKTFEKMFDELLPGSGKEFLNNLGDLIFDMTGNVNLRMAIFNISEKLQA